MRKIIFIGRSEAGKTTLTQAMKGKKIVYHKTQYINHFNEIIDTPGEYEQIVTLAHALAIYYCEADVVGLLIAATENYSLFPPNITCLTNRDTIGVVTKIHEKKANCKRAERWLRLSGCKVVFFVDSKTGEGIAELLSYLKEEGEVLAWEHP